MTTEEQRTRALVSARELMQAVSALSPPKPSILDLDLEADEPMVEDIEMMEIPVSIARRMQIVLKHYPWDLEIRGLSKARPDILSLPDDSELGRY